MSSHPSRLVGLVLCGMWWLLGSAGPMPVLAGESPPAAGESGDFSLPAEAQGGRILSPGALDAPPQHAAFLEGTGADWLVVWDRVLGTPRLLFPFAPLNLAAAPSGTVSDGLRAAVLSFVDRHEEFLGVGSGDLSEPGVTRLDDGYVIAAFQVHGGLPVRGSSLRARVNGDGAVRSIRCRVARALPELAAPEVPEDEISRIAGEEGIQDQVSRTLQVGFSGGLESAQAIWAVVGTSAAGEETEVLYSAVTGERLGARSTELHFDGGCDGEIHVEGSVQGYCPRPDDVYSMPFQFGAADLYPMDGVEVVVEAEKDGCKATMVVPARADGSFSLTVTLIPPDAEAKLHVLLGVAQRFVLGEGLDDYVNFNVVLPAGRNVGVVFNEELAEFSALHLMTFHHLRRAVEEADQLVRVHGLDVADEMPWRGGALVRVRNDSYAHRYLPFRREIVIANDERIPTDEGGRWRKVVPTILYHEYGHEFFQRLTLGDGDPEVNEGVCDAFSTYVARVSTLGFVDATTPNADSAARDLKEDRTAWPKDPRRTVAGALWELWETTLDPPDPARPDDKPRSSFAFGLLGRWLNSKRTGGANFLAIQPVEFVPWLGMELYLEADHPSLGGDNDLRNGFTYAPELIAAFGRRNLFQYPFIRGDSNGDGSVDISDAMTTLSYLFLDGPDTSCPDALDVDDSGRINITDPIYLLLRLFVGGAPIPEPSKCGFDDTVEDGISCWESACKLLSPRR